MKTVPLKAPFPAFGGKSRVASIVWDRLGDVVNYIEPFANSAAVLLARPTAGRIETINDINCHVANFWRAIRDDEEAVAEHADWPVNEADLHARHRWLVLSETSAEFRERMRADPYYSDARIAGWWAWGACCWIGSGWCETNKAESTQMPTLAGHAGRGGQGVHNEYQADQHALSQKLPDISGHAGGSGRGVHQSSGPSRKRPFLGSPEPSNGQGGSSPGRGVHRALEVPTALPEDRPHLSSMKAGYAGMGIHANAPREGRPQLADAFARGRGVNANDSAETCAARRAWLLDWFGRLSNRLRTVRVCCGDWLRVCDSFSVTTRLGVTGVFFDAPYKTHLADGTANRSADLYANDRTQDVNALVDSVIKYCVERGNDPLMRIAACCYEGEGYEVLADLGWDVISWKAGGGYANRNKAGSDNAARERIWFSPACQRQTKDRMPLFDTEGDPA